MTPLQEQTIAAYRSRHLIKPVKDWDDDLGQYVMRCETDHLRIYRLRFGARWQHDTEDIGRWERGDTIDWTFR